ncbi:DsbA family protein [Glycomyces sp. TRM65418]|uniref:DsbA family protein n=1 Tax=Glycomyces sp. TRM65418 TaxID=2867006 RepID=UPI001CE4D058|nr:thioredoxin domain-containing protein [Glycomyces sp. TRM65418]MCC3763791.1 DsbA family protein [Glycomyces sp. TRM65418]QZD53500.1 DsbA family protein [Glycomyces sp. TRM65418]
MGKSDRKADRRQAVEALRKQQAAEARRRKIVFGVAIGAAVVLIGGLLAVGIWMNREPEYEVNEPAAAVTDTYGIELGDGPVRIDLYIDYMCPACNQFESAYAEDLQSWLDTGSVTVVYHPLAILDRMSRGTEYSSRSAAAAVCAADTGEQQFLDYTLALYEHQPAEQTSGLSDDELIAIGTDEVGLGADWESCVESGKYRGWVQEGNEHATSQQGVSGTPTAKVNGEVVENSAFAEEVRAAIDAS